MNENATKPLSGVAIADLLAADETLAALAQTMAEEYQKEGQNWARPWMKKHAESMTIIVKARGILLDRVDAANAHVMAPGSAVPDSESTNQDGR